MILSVKRAGLRCRSGSCLLLRLLAEVCRRRWSSVPGSARTGRRRRRSATSTRPPCRVSSSCTRRTGSSIRAARRRPDGSPAVPRRRRTAGPTRSGYAASTSASRVGEVPVERADPDPDARFLRDRVQSDVRPLLRERPDGDLEEAIPVALRVGPQTWRPGCCWCRRLGAHGGTSLSLSTWPDGLPEPRRQDGGHQIGVRAAQHGDPGRSRPPRRIGVVAGQLAGLIVTAPP